MIDPVHCDGDRCDGDAIDVQFSRMECLDGSYAFLDLCDTCRADWKKRLAAYAAWESAGDDAYDRMKDDKLTGGGR